MIKKILKDKIIILLPLILVIPLGLFVLTLYLKPLKITSFSPQNQLKANFGSIIFELNKRIDPSHLTIRVSPKIEGAIAKDGNKYYFKPNEAFLYEVPYYFTLFYKEDILHQQFLIGPKQTSDQEALIENAKSVAKNFPLAYELPYEDENLKIQYIDNLTLEITVKNVYFDSESFIKQFLNRYGLDYQGHKYVWKTE